jgi:hypothetical protein
MECRRGSSEAQRQAFYDAIKPLAPAALEYLNSRSLNAFDPAEQRLMLLLLSFAHVAPAVELHREEEPKHARFRASMPITRAPADLPAAQ